MEVNKVLIASVTKVKQIGKIIPEFMSNLF